MMRDLKRLTEILHEENCSCVIENEDGLLTIGRERGVKDLMNFLKHTPAVMKGALIADKVVGKGAAALMILGGVRVVYAEVMSRKALKMYASYDITAQYGILVDNIINRSGTGICPVESLCLECKTAEECLPLIEAFIAGTINPQTS